MQDLRKGLFDVLVGVNLLREGLDLPEVSLVAILDADKEGFLRNTKSLTQTVGRAARNVNGLAIMYADKVTESMQKTIDETLSRRERQMAYNTAHNLQPKQIRKKIESSLLDSSQKTAQIRDKINKVAEHPDEYSKKEKESLIRDLTKKMEQAAKDLDFLEAANFRDQIKVLKTSL